MADPATNALSADYCGVRRCASTPRHWHFDWLTAWLLDHAARSGTCGHVVPGLYGIRRWPGRRAS
jgi:hypothetical protein